jgi:hypothetical protein
VYLLAAGAISGALLLGAGPPDAAEAPAGPAAGLLEVMASVVDVLVAAYVVSLVGLALVCTMARLRRRWTGVRP